MPTDEQIAQAHARLRRRLRGPWSMAGHEPFEAFMAALDDPFAQAYTSSSRLLVVGEALCGAESGEALRALAPAAVELYESRQGEAFRELLEALDGVDLLPILCGMVWSVRFEVWGSYFEPDATPRMLDLELVAAIAAGREVGDVRPAVIDDFERVAAAASAVRCWAQALGLAHRLWKGTGPHDMARDEVMLRWMVLRGHAYVEHARLVAEALANACGTSRLRAVGCEFSDVIAGADGLFRQWDQRMSGCMETAWRRAVKEIGESPSTLADGSEEFQHRFLSELLPLLPEALICPLDDVDREPADVTVKRSVIEAFGMRPGDQQPVKSVLVDPPQRVRPFLILRDATRSNREVALLVDPDAFSTNLHLTVERRLARTRNWPVLRAGVIDDLATTILRRVLPGCEVLSNVFIDGVHGREEVDGVVLYEDIAIVVEGKGAPLSTSARRGSVDKLVAQLKELVGEGSRQLERDALYLCSGAPARFYDDRGVVVREVDGSSIRRCYQLLPCLDGMLELGTSVPLLEDLGVLKPAAAPWLVSITELAMIADILPSPAQFVGYMEFRSRWQHERRLQVIDEVEMLSLFLYQVDLELRLLANPEVRLFHTPNQVEFDAWYHGRTGQGPVAERPRVRTTARFRRFVDERQRRREPGWLASCTATLQVPRTVATAIDECQRELAAEAATDGVAIWRFETTAVIVIDEDARDDRDLRDAARAAAAPHQTAILMSQRGRRLVLDDVTFQPSRPVDDLAADPSAEHDEHRTRTGGRDIDVNGAV